jgi:hypothetical protein
MIIWSQRTIYSQTRATNEALAAPPRIGDDFELVAAAEVGDGGANDVSLYQ